MHPNTFWTIFLLTGGFMGFFFGALIRHELEGAFAGVLIAFIILLIFNPGER